MRRFLGLALALAVLTVAGLPARATEAASRQERASRLLDSAEAFVERQRACRTFTLDHKPTFTDADPSAGLLSTLGILRRPEAPDERSLFKTLLPFGKDIYRHRIRIARSASGRSFLIYAARDSSFERPRPERCRTALRRRFRRLVRNRPRAFRRAALRYVDEFLRAERRREAAPPQEGIFLFTRSANDGTIEGGGGGGDASSIRQSGMFGSSSMGRRWDRAEVHGLVPDGVATVTAVYGRRGAFGPNRRRRYARVLRYTARVQDNVVSFTVARRGDDAIAPARWVWRSADGRVVRVVKPF